MINVSRQGAVLQLTLARPEKKNAINAQMYRALTEALVNAESDETIRVVMFAGEGDSFCAGNDLVEFAAAANDPRGPRDAVGFLHALADATKPYVAAVHGKAVGIGTTLLLHCDWVALAQDAQLSTPFVNLGLVPEAGSSALLPQRIGHVLAYEMIALGKALPAQRALQLGLANEVVPNGQLLDRGMQVAQELAGRPIGALRATKRLMRSAQTLRTVIDQEVQVFGERLKSVEAQTALKAFLTRGK
jgi:enoyl-CoA hydratase/carnithine racemase